MRQVKQFFFHPDYTVGRGVAPHRPRKPRFADYTASQELQPEGRSLCPEELGEWLVLLNP